MLLEALTCGNRPASAFACLCVVAVFGFMSAANAQQPPKSDAKAAQKQEQPSLRDDKSAIDAGRKWLELIDAGKAGPLWDDAAQHLKSAVTREQWVSGVRDMRKPFGKLKSREAVKFARTHELPDAPAGDYAIIQFESQFANGTRAVEQVVWMLEPDGIFRVSGYYIR